MTQTDTPWVHVGEPAGGFYDHPAFLPPGALARWQREEAAIRAEEQRKEQERTERADARQELALWEARQYSLARGLPWDPQRPFANVPDIYARADAAFAMQDREARARDLAAAREAGLVHLLHQSQPLSGGSLEPATGEGSGGATRGVPLIGPPDTSTPAGKARAALRRWAARERRQRMEQR